ncbi:hypothetical protein [Streptomyces pinistramenti]|uniref:hypothetical protein n=1 Tax=Streptomyces pinistramenti TaxID=2884812 RepID=UPI001D05D508|nr:hypothetical protein [Streptomyces pinistramenti]MCB5908637.1 hypothetical protein [Streptomyces pinistramenti]
MARCPEGGEIGLGGSVAYSPGGALSWVRRRAEQVAQQLGAPYDGTVQAWLADPAEQRWATEALVAGVPVLVRAVDEGGWTYTCLARPERAALRVGAPHPRKGRAEVAVWSAA